MHGQQNKKKIQPSINMHMNYFYMHEHPYPIKNNSKQIIMEYEIVQFWVNINIIWSNNNLLQFTQQ